jgi:penicillin-binding protein 1A
MRLKVIIACAVVLVGSMIGAYIALAMGIPSIEELKKQDSAAGTKIYADDDTLIGELKLQRGIFVPLSKMPDNLKNAIVAVEDSRFLQHSGIDYIGISRALFKDVLHLSLKEGGSTITQQLAKIVFLSSEKTLIRKIKEAQLALKIEKELSKKEILELYLNRAFFGHGAYGVEMAARTYFGKSITQVNLAEAAMIAGLVKAPNSYSPFTDLVKAKERQAVVLMRMVEEGYLKQPQADAAKKLPLLISQARSATEAYNYFIDYVRQYLVAKYGEERVYKGDLRVHTTLDKNAQLNAQKALQEGLREIDKRRGWRGVLANRENVKEVGAEKISFSATVGDISRGVVMSVSPKEAVIKSRGITGKLLLADANWAATVIDKGHSKSRPIKDFKLTDILKKGDVILVKYKTIAGKNVSFSLEQEPEIEGALAAVEPATGFIRALVGGFSYTKSDYNRAVMSQRQPGSSFKPIIYAAAMERGYTPATVIVDEPVSYSKGAGADDEWKPANYDKKFLGPTRLREGLAYSRNVITVKLVDMLGVDRIIELARNLGINGNMERNLSIALGSTGATPLDMASAFAVFSNGGIKVKTNTIKFITDGRGEVLESSQTETTPVLSPQSAFLITSMLEDVITYGTGQRAKLGRPAAGKTGTSNDYKDAWFVGYTPELSTAVWIGFDDMRRSLGHGEVGGRAAAPVWQHFMANTLSGHPATNFVQPAGIARVRIDAATGLLADYFAPDSSTVMEYFKEGTVPTEKASLFSAPARQIVPGGTD